MPRCKPGDLCVVIAGPSTGLSVTVLEPVTAQQTIDYAFYVKGDSMLPNISPGEQLWLIDKEVVWHDISGEMGDIEMPFECDSWLMPIGKKQDEKQTKKEMEKTP